MRRNSLCPLIPQHQVGALPEIRKFGLVCHGTAEKRKGVTSGYAKLHLLEGS